MVCFNRRREANPLATVCGSGSDGIGYLFQSQTRSQSPGDVDTDVREQEEIEVSIADAKPIPWRHNLDSVRGSISYRFNRRREANPLATYSVWRVQLRVSWFQSQ